MAKSELKGVYQLENGCWGYRYVIIVDGKRKDVKKNKDESGNPYKTDKAAFRAREQAMQRDKINATHKPYKKRVTVAEVYHEYCEFGRNDKAYTTALKQDSLWRNHIQERFGKRFICEISVAEINDYLSMLYYNEGRAYRYVESFLKMFYLIFGQAYSRDYIDVNTYNKLCTDKNTRIHMPKKKTDEDSEIIAFSKEQTAILDEYFKGTNAETAYMLGRYCGLRINECYGLKWENIDLRKGEIHIEQQMQYQDGVIKLVSLKTHNARRILYMNEKLKDYFQQLEKARAKAAVELSAQREQNQTIITDINGNQISSLELVNSLPNGKIQTVNSMKYHSKTIKTTLNINFKYHLLRHTFGTRLAEMNTPSYLLCNQMGHASSRVTERYYLAITKSGINVLRNNLNEI